MAKQRVLIGATDYTVLVKIRDTAGAAKTALTEASIDIAYARVETDNDVTTTDVTPAALSALTDAHTDWGFEEVSATDHPGLYRLDIADAVFASGAWSAVVTVTGTGLDPADMEFELVAVNDRDGVRHGMTALPNAAADAAGGLPISDAGGLDLDAQQVSIAAILVDTTEIGAAGAGLTNINLPNQTMDIVGNITGNLSGSVGSVTGAVGSVTGAVGSIGAGGIAAASFAANAITAAKLDPDVTTELQSGLATSSALATAQTSLDDIPTNAELATALGTADDAVLSAINDLPTNAELATALGTADDAVLAAIAALNNLSAAQVNAEVLDVLNVDTFAQPGQGTPAATTTIRLMVAYLYKLARNKKLQTATQFSLLNDDAVTVDQKATTSDDGVTGTVGELATGP